MSEGRQKTAQDLLAEITAEQSKRAASMAGIAGRLIEKFGGEQGFVDAMYDDYESMPQQSSQRAILGRAFMELIKEHARPSGGNPEDDMQPDELLAAAELALKRAQGG